MESEVSRSASQKRMTRFCFWPSKEEAVLCLSETGEYGLKSAMLNAFNITQVCQWLEADREFGQKRSEVKEGRMMLQSAFWFHFLFCSSVRVEISRKYNVAWMLQEITVNQHDAGWVQFLRLRSHPILLFSSKEVENTWERASCPCREKVKVPQTSPFWYRWQCTDLSCFTFQYS